MSEVLAQLQKKGGGVDIDIERGYALLERSDSGLIGLYDIASSSYTSSSSLNNNMIIAGFSNVQGYTKLTLIGGNNNVNHIVMGIKSDGTVSLVGNVRNVTKLEANVTDYDYVYFSSTTMYGNVNSVRLT